MVRFVETTFLIGRGKNRTDKENDGSKSHNEKALAPDVGEKKKNQDDDEDKGVHGLVVDQKSLKKRYPVTPHPIPYKKKKNQEQQQQYHSGSDGVLNLLASQVDSPDAMTANSTKKTSHGQFMDVSKNEKGRDYASLELEKKKAAIAGKEIHDMDIPFKETEETKVYDDDYCDDDEEEKVEETERERHAKEWKTFASKTDKKDAPKLEEYLLAKRRRIQYREKCEVAIGECIRDLQELSVGIVSGTSRPVCARLENKLTSMERDITAALVSNHSRRKSCLDRMGEADRKWQKQYAKVTASILSGDSYSKMKKKDMSKLKTSEKNQCVDGNPKATPRKDEETDPKVNEQLTLSDSKTSPKSPQPDWTAICEFEPAQKSVFPMLNAKEESGPIVTKIDSIQSRIDKRIGGEMTALIERVEFLMDSLEGHYVDFEDDIERNMMNNHRRRLEYQQRVEKSAKQAQSLFSGLLSGLFNSLG